MWDPGIISGCQGLWQVPLLSEPSQQPNSKYFLNFILCTLVFCLHSCLCEGVGSPEAVSTDSCELSCGCWELNPGPLEEQPGLSAAEPSLQPLPKILLPQKDKMSANIQYRLTKSSLLPTWHEQPSCLYPAIQTWISSST